MRLTFFPVRNKSLSLILYTLAFGLLVFLVEGSDGDERPEFITCVSDCVKHVACKLNRLLVLTKWDCQSDCKYSCMRADVGLLRYTGRKIVQYYGKWPFIRIFGAQEVFSVVFSLGNMLANIYGYFCILTPFERSAHWMTSVHQVNFLVAINTWLQSAVFHYRDTPLTEKLDYFSACLCICTALVVATIRIWRIKAFFDQLFVVILPIAALYLQHIYHMTFIKFDYGYNIKFNAVIGLIVNGLWLYWAINHLKYGNTRLGRQMIFFVLSNFASMGMVAVDFPPFFDLIDMHALWHLSTIPVTILWYHFLKTDIEVDRLASNLKE